MATQDIKSMDKNHEKLIKSTDPTKNIFGLFFVDFSKLARKICGGDGGNKEEIRGNLRAADTT